MVAAVKLVRAQTLDGLQFELYRVGQCELEHAFQIRRVSQIKDPRIQLVVVGGCAYVSVGSVRISFDAIARMVRAVRRYA